MSKTKRTALFLIIMVLVAVMLTGCGWGGTASDNTRTLDIGNRLAENQPTPSDIEYSLERYNLVRRTYWVNGMREKARTLPSSVVKPFGYVVLITNSGAVVGRFTVDGKVSSLNSFLTPDTTRPNHDISQWLPDVDGSYGDNDSGIFFFTTDGNYIEWNGTYLYSDIPFEVANPVVTYKTGDSK